jgi:hypothetical protein
MVRKAYRQPHSSNENVTDKLGEISRFSPCATSVCTSPNVVTLRPRSFGLNFGQRF